MNLDELKRADDLDGLSEAELLDLYMRVREVIARRFAGPGSESVEMLMSRVAEAVEPPATPSVRISPREREVLHFLAQDKTNKQIATTLFVSENTIKHHVANILGKYAVRTRQGAVMAALREGVLTVD